MKRIAGSLLWLLLCVGCAEQGGQPGGASAALAAVGNLEVRANDSRSVTLAWKNPADSRFGGVRIRCKRDDGFFSETIFRDAVRTSADIGGLRYRAHRPYEFTVETLTTDGEPGGTATVSANCSKTAAFEGSFIQHWLFLDWDDARWANELNALQEAGIRYLVIVPTAQGDGKGGYDAIYPSELSELKQMTQGDALDVCLRNCEQRGVQVFVGLNFDVGWWSGYSREWLLAQMELGTRMADEIEALYGDRYPNALYGWYWCWEVDNVGSTRREKQALIADALSVTVDHRNARGDRRPILFCPFMNPQCGSAADYGLFWKAVFARVDFREGDIFAPQDCVGTEKLKLEDLPFWFETLRQAAITKPGLRFWADTEIFRESDWSSAPLERVVLQMEAVLPYVEGLLSFAYSHYYAPGVGKGDCHEAYLRYLSDDLGW